MADNPSSPAGAPPGWYPDGGGLRWWDGAAWTGHTAVPIAPARRRSRLGVTGLVLLVSAVLVMSVGGVAVMGDPYPVSRLGVSAPEGSPLLLNAACSGERLLEVRLSRRNGTSPSTELWRLAGDAPVPAQLALGDAPPGMRVVTPLVRVPRPDEPLALEVTTSELTNTYPMDFSLSEVPAEGVLSFGDRFSDATSFRDAVLDSVPCGDPYSERRGRRLLAVAAALAGCLVVSGVACVVAGRSRDRRAAARLPT